MLRLNDIRGANCVYLGCCYGLILLQVMFLNACNDVNQSHQSKAPNIGDAVHLASRHGIDYKKLFDASMAGDEMALVEMIRLTNKPVFDGSGSLTHSDVLLYLLEARGDAAFSRALNQVDSKTRAYIVDRIKEAWCEKIYEAYPQTIVSGVE